MAPPRRLEVGRIDRPHGVRGDVLVTLTTNRVERVAEGAVLFVDERPLEIVRSRPHQHRHLVTFAGVGDRAAAEALAGSRLTADAIEDDEALWVHELIGRTVVNLDGGPIGTVAAVEANPASDLLVLDGGELVPSRFVVERRDDGSLVVDLPDGLLDL